MSITPEPIPEGTPSILATLTESLRTFVGLERDAKTQARVDRKQALAPFIAKIKERKRELQGFTKAHGSELEELERILTAPEIQADAHLFQAAEPLRANVEGIRSQLTRTPVGMAKLIADAKSADTDAALDGAEVRVRDYVMYQCQRSMLPDLEVRLAEALEQGRKVERYLTARRTDPEAAPATVRAYPARYTELDFTRPAPRSGQAITEFNVFNTEGNVR